MSSSLTVSRIEEIGKDIAEFRSLLTNATRQRVKDTIQLEIWKLETDLSNKEEILRQEQLAAKQGRLDGGEGGDNPESDGSVAGASKPTAQIKPIYTKQLDSYGWDQSEKFMKLYVTVKGVQSLPKDNVHCDFTASSLALRINELENFNYQLRIVNLLHTIIPDQSYIKIKTDSVLVMLKKEKNGKTWAFVTKQEKKAKDKPEKPSKKPDFDKDDPNASMMKLMQQMYDDGDDDMKRTITKAWYESRNKTTGSDSPGMTGL